MQDSDAKSKRQPMIVLFQEFDVDDLKSETSRNRFIEGGHPKRYNSTYRLSLCA